MTAGFTAPGEARRRSALGWEAVQPRAAWQSEARIRLPCSRQMHVQSRHFCWMERTRLGATLQAGHLLGRSTPGERDSQPLGARHRFASRVQTTTTKQRSGAAPRPGFPGNGHVVDRARPQTSWSTYHGAGARLLLRCLLVADQVSSSRAAPVCNQKRWYKLPFFA
jgi:hypothetical protein